MFGERFKPRELKGLTQKQLADAIGVNQSTIDIEREIPNYRHHKRAL